VDPGSRRSALVFGVALVAFISLGLPDTVLGVAWPSMRRTFDLALDRLGAVLFCATLGYQASSFVSGPVARRFGVGGVLVGSSALVALSALGFALSPGFGPLLVASVILGLGGGAIDACVNAFAARHFSAGRVAWLHASFGVGASLGPMLMTGVLALGLSWRVGYAALALVIALLGIGFRKTRDLWHDGPLAGAMPAHAALGHSARLPVVHGSGLLFLVYSGVEAIPGAWAYSLLTEGRGMPEALAGTSVALYWSGLTLGRMASGAIAHRVAPLRLLRGSLLLAPAWIALLWAGLGFTLDLVAVAGLGITVGPVFPLLISATPGRVGDAHSANAVGIQISLASLGWAVLPAAAGVLARRRGLEVIPPFLLLCALAVVLLHEALLASSRPALAVRGEEPPDA
jgi:fucose permease